MKRIRLLSLSLSLTTSMAFAQSAPAAQNPSPTKAQVASSPSAAAPDNMIRGSFPVTLVRGLDSKKLKPGDQVICQTVAPIRSPRGLFTPSGAKVIGHITQATARGKGDSDSSLAMVFDKIELNKGKELDMKGWLQAVGPSLGERGPDTGAASSGSVGGGGSHDGGYGAFTTPPATHATVAGPDSGPQPSHPLLNAQSGGALGFHNNLEMDKNNVLTSKGKEVKLESGTQMMIRAEIPEPIE